MARSRLRDITRYHQPSLGTTTHHRTSPGTTDHHFATSTGGIPRSQETPGEGPYMDTAPPGSCSAYPKSGCTSRPSPKIHRELTPSLGGAFPTLLVGGALAQAKAHPNQIWVGNHQSEQVRLILLTPVKVSSPTPSPQVPTEQAGQLKSPKPGH